MKHAASVRFWHLYCQLPSEIRKQADKSYRLLRTDSSHPSLHLKRIGQVWSARVTHQYRAVGTSKLADGDSVMVIKDLKVKGTS